MSQKRIKTTTRAVVTLTIEIPLHTTWSAGCSVSQVHAQALRSATESIRKATETNILPRASRILSGAKVQKIFTEERA